MGEIANRDRDLAIEERRGGGGKGGICWTDRCEKWPLLDRENELASLTLGPISTIWPEKSHIANGMTAE